MLEGGPAQQEVLNCSTRYSFHPACARRRAVSKSKRSRSRPQVRMSTCPPHLASVGQVSRSNRDRVEPYDSRCVYGVSCRVRAKSYPNRTRAPIFTPTDGSPVPSREAGIRRFGFAAITFRLSTISIKFPRVFCEKFHGEGMWPRQGLMCVQVLSGFGGRGGPRQARGFVPSLSGSKGRC